MCCPGTMAMAIDEFYRQQEEAERRAKRGYEPADDDGADGKGRHGQHGRGSLFEVENDDLTGDGRFGTRYI